MIPLHNAVLEALPPSVRNAITPRLRLQTFHAGQTLFSRAEAPSSVWFPVQGAVSLVTKLADGDRVETAMVGRNSIVGGGAVLADGNAQGLAIVQIPGSGYALDMDTARNVARESEAFLTALVRHEQLILAQAQQTAACTAKHGLYNRVARWLLWARDVTGHDKFSITQELMAQSLGVRRTSITVIAKSLQREGLIANRRGTMELKKPGALQEIACECYHTIRLRYGVGVDVSGAAGAPPDVAATVPSDVPKGEPSRTGWRPPKVASSDTERA